MAKVFSAPNSIPLPQWSIKKTHQENMAEEKAYLDQLKDMLTKRKPTQKLVGEIIRFPAADGYAEYITKLVASEVIIRVFMFVAAPTAVISSAMERLAEVLGENVPSRIIWNV